MPPIPAELMTDAQQAAAHELEAGRRGGVIGPFVPLLRSPEFLNRIQRAGEYLRYDSHIEPRLSELVILMTARRWTQQFEWHAHSAIALSVGVGHDTVNAIADGRRPTHLREDESVTYDTVEELFRIGTLSDETYQRAVSQFREAGLIDLLGIVGYYSLIAMIMNVTQTALPAGVEPPLRSFL